LVTVKTILFKTGYLAGFKRAGVLLSTMLIFCCIYWQYCKKILNLPLKNQYFYVLLPPI